MDDRLRLEALIADLGYDRTAASVYGAVLTCGPLARPALATILGTESSEMDRALAALERAGLIGSVVRRQRRRQFYAVDPAIAWPALARARSWRGGPAAAVEALADRCRAVAILAGRLHRSQTGALAHQEWDASDPDELARLICELISRARKSVVAVSRSPHLPHVASFWTALTQRLAAGVSYRRVVDLEEVVAHGLGLVRRDVEQYGIDLRVLERDRIEHKFYLVDGVRLAVFHGAGSRTDGQRRHGIGRITRRGAIARRYAKRFEAYARAALPAAFVVGELRAASARLLRTAAAMLPRQEVAWLESLVLEGKFSQFAALAGWSTDELAGVGERATTLGLVRRSEDGAWVPAYPLTESDLRRAYLQVAGDGHE